MAAVADGTAIGAMKIPRNFSKELSITFGNLVGNSEILPEERDIAVYLDMSGELLLFISNHNKKNSEY